METKVFVFSVEGFSFLKFYKKEAKPVREVNKLFANLLKSSKISKFL